MTILNDKVLLLNKHMEALRLITVRKALKNIVERIAMAFEVDEEHQLIRPVPWEEWAAMPVREGDRVVHTAKAEIRVPSIVVLSTFARQIVLDQKLNKASLWRRQEGRDIYTLQKLDWDDCDIDHYIPRSKKGKTSWDNCGLTSIPNNRMKGDRMAAEVGLALQMPLEAPKPKPMFVRIEPDPRFPEWDCFLGRKK